MHSTIAIVQIPLLLFASEIEGGGGGGQEGKGLQGVFDMKTYKTMSRLYLC